MFLFYHPEQNEKNKDYYKGVLFEKVLREYLECSGYNVELRKKHNSLEYDIEGTSKTIGQKIVGEAKAHSKSMSGQSISAFVGKLLPMGLMEKKVHGLFLSLSPLSPEAEDYFSTVSEFGVTTKTGETIYQEMSEVLSLPQDKLLKLKIEKEGYDVVAPNILVCPNNIYKLLILKKKSSGTPSVFVVYNKDSSKIVDDEFQLQLRESLPELSGFDYFTSKTVEPDDAEVHSREIAKGLSVGNDWADYRLPAGPSVFVGRENFISHVRAHIKTNQMPHVMQIKSRSGVGKSSVISYLEDKFSQEGFVTELHDSRDVKTIYDVFSLVARFCGASNIPTTFPDLDKQLNQLQAELLNKSAIFFVDQFESTFINPDIFECYEYIANSITRINGTIYIVFARKNDQLTTYDDTKVSLNRINSQSISYTLPDFERDESILLLEKINSHNGNILSKEILPYVIEFAQGFPWLLKRTIAHILKLTKSGDSQKTLISAGLKLNDLFEEELEGLDEIEKDYLTKIASKLPADFKELQLQFDEDPMLVKVLDKLTNSRLVRLSGSTYDTYNDVFKEYLVYQKLPEFRQLVIYRMYPSSVIAQFHKLIEFHPLDIDNIKKDLDVSEGYAFNLVKELRNLDLLDLSKDGGWIIPTNIRDIYSQGQLAAYLRRKLMDNHFVESLISKIISGDSVRENDIPHHFSESYPFIEASEKTWRLYSTILKSWLLSLKIITITKDGELTLTEISHSEAATELGNLHQFSGIRSGNKGLFFPVTSFSMMAKVTQKILDGIEPETGEETKAKADLKNAGILVGTQLAISNTEELSEALSGQLLDEGYKELWDSINNNTPCYEIFKKIVGENLTESTIKWRLRKVTALAKKLEIIPNRRLNY